MRYNPRDLGLVTGKLMGNEMSVVCPFHSDHNPSATFNVNSGLFFCFVCKKGMTLRQLAAELKVEVVEDDGVVSMMPMQRTSGTDVDWLARWQAAPPALGSLYLASRGVTDEQVIEFDLREDDDAVLFPMVDQSLRVLGFQARRKHGEPRYKTHGVRTPVWPWQRWSPERTPRLLVEGVFGALNMRRLGYDAFATLSSSVPKTSWTSLSPWGQQIVVLYDDDPAGHLGMRNISLKLGARVAWPGGEADEMGASEAGDLIRNAATYVSLLKDERIER